MRKHSRKSGHCHNEAHVPTATSVHLHLDSLQNQILQKVLTRYIVSIVLTRCLHTPAFYRMLQKKACCWSRNIEKSHLQTPMKPPKT